MVAEKQIILSDYSGLILDTQGAELLVLKGGVYAVGGKLIKPLEEHGFGGNGFDSERIGKKFISPIQINIIKIVSAVTEESDLGEKNVSITDCIGSARLEIFGQSLLRVIFKK